MNIKRDSISELKEKLASTLNVIRDGKKVAQNLKKRMANFINNDKTDNPPQTENLTETKRGIRYSDYEIVTDNDEKIRIISPDKNGKPPLE